jgi:acyl-CoA synthetase (AMP-forming)/AMP-acid ligase II
MRFLTRARVSVGSLKVKDVVVAHTANNVAGVLFAGSATQNASNPAAGRLLPHIEAKLVDGGKAAKSGTTGKLYVRGYAAATPPPCRWWLIRTLYLCPTIRFNVAKGQWGAGAEHSIVDKEGWLDTGLQASASADGLYTIKH